MSNFYVFFDTSGAGSKLGSTVLALPWFNYFSTMVTTNVGKIWTRISSRRHCVEDIILETQYSVLYSTYVEGKMLFTKLCCIKEPLFAIFSQSRVAFASSVANLKTT